MRDTLDLPALLLDADRVQRLLLIPRYLLFTLFGLMLLLSFTAASPAGLALFGALSAPLVILLCLGVLLNTPLGLALWYSLTFPKRDLLRDYPPIESGPRLALILGWLGRSVGWIVVLMLALLLGAAPLALVLGPRVAVQVASLPVLVVFVIGLIALNVQREKALRDGDTDRALRFTRLSSMGFTGVTTWQLLITLNNADRSEEALALAEQHLARTPRLALRLADALHAYALVLVSMRRFEEALPPLALAIRLTPHAVNAYLTLVEWYLAQDSDQDRAQEILTLIKPRVQPLLLVQGLGLQARLHLKRGERRQALETFHLRRQTHQTLTQSGRVWFDPRAIMDADLDYQEGEIQRELGDYPAARAAFERAAASDPHGRLGRLSREALAALE